MQAIRFAVCFILLSLPPVDGLARQRPLNQQEKTFLKNAQTIFLQTVALTEKGPASSDTIRSVVTQRFQRLGYSIVENREKSHDVTVKVKCEERKTRTGPVTYGGDADSMHSPLQGWKGPACLISYGFKGEQLGWQKEIRTDFENAIATAKKHQMRDSGAYALEELSKKLEQDNFPLLLTAEWNQPARLISALKHSETQRNQKVEIIRLLGRTSDAIAFSALKEALRDPLLAPTAAVALGQQGEQAEKILVKLLETAQTEELKVSAVKGLGEIGTHSAKSSVFTPLVASLRKPNTEVPVKTEIVRALGKLGDQEAVPVLEKLNYEAWSDPSMSPEMKNLREALTWSLWQLNPEAHTG